MLLRGLRAFDSLSPGYSKQYTRNLNDFTQQVTNIEQKLPNRRDEEERGNKLSRQVKFRKEDLCEVARYLENSAKTQNCLWTFLS